MDEIKDRKSEDTKMKESLRKLADSIGAEAKREERGEDESLKDVAPGLGTVVAPGLAPESGGGAG